MGTLMNSKRVLKSGVKLVLYAQTHKWKINSPENLSSPRLFGGSGYSIFSFLCNHLQIVVCPFVLFLLVIALYVLLRFTASDYPFGIFKLDLVDNGDNVGRITVWGILETPVIYKRLSVGRIVCLKPKLNIFKYQQLRHLYNVYIHVSINCDRNWISIIK